MDVLSSCFSSQFNSAYDFGYRTGLEQVWSILCHFGMYLSRLLDHVILFAERISRFELSLHPNSYEFYATVSFSL